MAHKAWMTQAELGWIPIHALFATQGMNEVSGTIDITRRRAVSVVIDPNNPKIPDIEWTIFWKRTHDSIFIVTTDLQEEQEH